MTLRTMNNNRLLCLILFVLIAASCRQQDVDSTRLQAIEEIREAERAFCQMAKDDGIGNAFVEFVADSGVLLRSGKLHKGKSDIQQFFDLKAYGENVTLTWAPDFIDASKSGDMGYTYGGYTFTTYDSANNEKIVEGTFHTVWKKQSDGQWKYTWD